jgi:CDP-diacylglycerol---serine O-phosphatidyltransferase
MISKYMKLADLFTLLNLCSGVLAIIFAVQGKFYIASVLIIAAALFDLLDGKVARLSKKDNDFGKQLDSLTDAISFGVAPALLGYFLGLNEWYFVIVLLIYVSCGVLRLARFNITTIKGFEGVPITAAGIIIAVLVFLAGFYPIIISYLWIAYLLLGILMISSIPIKKI